MNILKAFAQIGPLVDNAVGVVAPIGELSDMSKTFAREKTYHVHAEFPNEALTSFSYKVNDKPTQLTDAIAYQALVAVNWVYVQAKGGFLDERKDSFQQLFKQNNGDKYDLIDSGTMIAFGRYWAPEYIEIAPVNKSGDTRWKIWFADSSFANQYDEYTILVIPPLLPVDQFYDSYNDVKDLVAGIRQDEVLARADVAKGVFPYTVLRPDVFTWQDKSDKTLRLDTVWITIVYGAAGNNLDAVKEAIRTYILANSTHNRDQWAEVFPDLFTSTEFIITPLWNNYSVPNEVRETGVYSGIIPGVAALSLAQKTAKGAKYTDAHVAKVWSGVPTQYKSLMTVIVGGPENRDGIDMFAERYPDYMNVPTTYIDFMRMSQDTRGFVMMLVDMLAKAEEMTPNTGVPSGYNRLVRDGIVYIAKSYNKFLFLVVTKYSVQALG